MIDNDWNKFIELTGCISQNYGKVFELAKQNLWWQVLSDVSIGDLERAVFKHIKISPYEPKPADLIALAQPDFDEIFDRLINRGKPANEIERATWGSVGYACRTQLKEDVARLRFKSEYLRQVDISKRPRAPQAHQIEHEKPVNIKDQMVDSELHRYKGMTDEERYQMLKAFKKMLKITKRTDGL